MCRALAGFADLVLFAPRGSGAAAVELPGNVRRVDVAVPARPPRSLGFQVRLTRAMRREAAAGPPPAVYYARPCTVNTPGLLWARRRGIPALLEVNGVFDLEYELEHPPRGAAGRVARSARRAANDLAAWLDYRLATGILPVTEQLAAYVRRRYGIPRDRFMVAAIGADSEHIRPGPPEEARRRLGLAVPGTLLGYVGVLAAWQGVDTLLRAFALAVAERPELTLIVAGGGAQEEALHALARELGVQERIVWTGAQPHLRALDVVQACDAVVAPFPLSPRNRTTGIEALKIGEAMAAGRPIVTTRCPGLEWIESEGVGALAAPGDPGDLAARLIEMAERPQQRVTMGARGRRLAETSRSWRAIAAEVAAFAERQRRERAADG